MKTKLFIAKAMVYTLVSAYPGEPCGVGSGQEPGSCGATACCGKARTDVGNPDKFDIVCSDDFKSNPN